ncbi:MAG: hypothetical protein HZB91_04710 [Elusimicrobia bacterium]|nr:hypothetical protein [Elusimicrobiota bacterium]
MRFSDVNKNKKEPDPSAEEKAPPKASPAQGLPIPRPAQESKSKSLFRSPLATRSKQPEGPPPQAQVGKPGRVDELKTATKSQVRAAHDCYGNLVSTIKEASAEAQEGAPISERGLSRATADCADLLQTRPYPLLGLTSRSTASNYLYGHSANVCVLSTYLGLGLGWEKEQTRQLSLAALLHELRLSSLLGLPFETGSPTAEEERETRLHPTTPPALKQHLANIEETITQCNDDIPDPKLAGHVIGICCLYEAMSHFRAWREPVLPHDAVRGIIKTFAEVFDRPAKHLFLSRLTLYPPGSYVQLSRGEIACVLAVDARTPTLPTVSVRVSSEGVLLDPPQEVELATNSLVHIERPVDETKLSLKDRKALMSLEAERWWVA